MWCLSLNVGPVVWSLMYRTEESLLKAVAPFENTLNATPNNRYSLIDDFGHRAMIKESSLHGWMIEDWNKTKIAQVEHALHQARTQADAQKAAYSDPALRAVAQGPSVISPMGNGRFSQ